MGSKNCYINSKVINDATLLANTRLGFVNDKYSLDAGASKDFPGNYGTWVLPVGKDKYLLAFDSGYAVWKSPVKLNMREAYSNYISLRDGSRIGNESVAITEVKIGNYYYYIDTRFKKYCKDIKTQTPYHTLSLAKTPSTPVTIEWFRCDDNICRTEQDFINWFESLPTITTTKYLYFGKIKPQLDSTKKIATDKGWTLV